MDKALLILFIISSSLVFMLMLYPLLAYLRALIIKNPVNRSDDFIKPVSIIIAAYNEENFIKEKILFFLNKEEWIPGSEIIVVSSGSNDNTNTILKEFENSVNIRPLIIEDKLVKPQALNIAVPYSKHEILIFSDCRQFIKKGAVKKLLSYFNDESVGAVNSTISDTKNGGRPSIIRAILNSVCLNESISGSSLNIHGALYAQRKSVFREFPNDILFDDLFAVVSTINQKKRLVQAKDVLIYDINFDKYYDANRMERLARGFMIFLFVNWKDIRKLPLSILLRFIIYRYLKFLLPFLIIGILIPLIYFLLPIFTKVFLLIFGSVSLILFLIKPSRKAILLFLRINFYFATALFKFFVLNKRQISWDKLTSEQIT